MRNLKHRRLQGLSIVLVLGILGLLAWQLVRDWRNLPPGFFQSVRASWFIGSLVALVPALLMVSFRWSLTLQAMRIPIGWWDAVRIWFLSQAGRYVPGGVWNYVARVCLGQAKVSRQAAVTSMALETGLRIVSELLVFVLSLPFWPDRDFLTTDVALLLAGGIVLGLVLLHPALLQLFGRWELLRRVGLEIKEFSGLRYRTLLVLLVYYVLSVVAVGGAFFLLVVAFYPLQLDLLPALVGSLALSVVLGFLVPLVPNGWGVREGVLAFLLSRVMPLPVSVVIALAARVWLTLGEAIWILVAAGTWRGQYLSSGID